MNENKVVVVDFDMPFLSLVRLFIKMAFASIPALIVVWTVIGALAIASLALTGGAGWLLNQAISTPTP